MDNSNNNPANIPGVPDNYRPMTDGEQSLKVAERPGYHRHWFRGTPSRLARAQQAGYTFVKEEDVLVTNKDLGGDGSVSGSTDLGSRVSVVSGAVSDDGQAERLYLMECPQELFEHAQKILAERNESVAEALRSGMIGSARETSGDVKHRYVKGSVPDLFNPRR